MSSYSEIEQLIARYDRSVGGLEDDALSRISDSLDAAYRNLEQELRRIYPQWQSQGSLYAAQRRLLLMSELGDLLSIVRPEQDLEYQQLFEELLQTAHLTGATLADELVNIVEPSYPLQEFSTIPIEAAVLQARDGMERLKRYDQEFRTAASAIVEQGLIQGWGAGKVAQNLRSQLGVTKSKAETLARTEVMSALNDAAQQRYEQNDVEWFEWVATPSERLCAFCAGRDGNFYQVGTVRLPSHPRCRCIVSPVKAKWLEKGLIDTEAIAQRRADGIAELRKRGIEPNYGPTYWEKKAGAEAAPEPVWKPSTKPSRSSKAKAVPSPTAAPPVVELPKDHNVTTNKRYQANSLDKALDAIATPGAAERVQQFRSFVDKHQVQAVLHDVSGNSNAQFENVKESLKYQKWALGPVTLKKYTQAMKGAGGYTHQDFDHVVVNTASSRSGAFKVDSEALQSRVNAVLSAQSKGKEAWALPYAGNASADSTEFLAYLHEMGHQVHFKAGNPKPPKNSPAMTEYAASDPAEWFAEHFALWMVDADSYRQVDAVGARFVEDSLQQAIAADRRKV